MSTPTPRFCTSCGTPVSTAFCTACGTPATLPVPPPATAVRPVATLPEETMVSDALPLDETVVRPGRRAARRAPASPPPELPALPPP
ncbi:MAG: hypothetical protein ACI379_13555, partial [Nocardioides sp.]|uniref:hypothetical protein n=1 Tax=Nocardioides sp. TaxID=35761 RepID=UPI003F11FA9F